MNKRLILSISFLLFFIEAITVYWFKLGFFNPLLREAIYLTPPFFAFIACLIALRTFGLSTSRSLTLIFLTAGIGYWFLGEVLFDYYAYILQSDPYPSAADIFYILAYPMLFFGLVNEIRLAKISWKNLPKPTLFLFSLVALLFASFVGYFGIFQAYNPAETLLNNIVAMSYGVGDLLLILVTILLLVLVWEFRGGKLSRVWLILFFGYTFTLVADILFAIYRDHYTMQEWFYKSLLDTFWILGYLLFAAALFEFSFSIQDAYHKAVAQANEKGVAAPTVS